MYWGDVGEFVMICGCVCRCGCCDENVGWFWSEDLRGRL